MASLLHFAVEIKRFVVLLFRSSQQESDESQEEKVENRCKISGTRAN